MAQGKGGGKFKHKQRIKEFWKKVEIKGLNDCWPWLAGKSGGYGQFWNGEKHINAHVYSYELKNGKMPVGYYGCHSCDNQICVNPEHIFAGTQSENMQDMERKKRSNHPKGVTHKRAKITEYQVQMIRKDKRSNVTIAKELNLGHSTIRDIKKRITWKHI